MHKLLVVDDNPKHRATLARIAGDAGVEILQASTPKEALDSIREQDLAVIVTDLRLDSEDLAKEEGLEVLKEALEKNSNTQVIVVTTVPDKKSCVKAIKSGAFDYLNLASSDISFSEMLLLKIKQALIYGGHERRS